MGLVRETNQDRYEYAVLSERLAFAVLCDGMGGQNGGNVASEIATGFIAEALRRDLHGDMQESSLRAVMLSAVAGANALVYETACKDEALAGMGTTLVIAVFLQEHLYVAYVGDSRAYLVRGEREIQLTKDHTVVQMLVDIGEISQSDAHNHPKRHYITRAVGVSPTVDPDFLEHPLKDGDLALLCSDGLYHYLTPGTLPPLLRESARAGSVSNLLDLAREGGGADNVTAVVAQVIAGSAGLQSE